MRRNRDNGWLKGILVSLLWISIFPLHAQQGPNPVPSSVSPASASTIPQDRLLQPQELNGLMESAVSERPLILQVGSHVLYAEAHIPGADYAGPGKQPDGLELLRNRVTALPRNQFIVIYCGCCPWGRCPNIGPAYRQLSDMGFTNVRVLYIAENFGTDWVAKGYRVEKGR